MSRLKFCIRFNRWGPTTSCSAAFADNMAPRHTEIAIQFKRAPFQLFRKVPLHKSLTNTLVIQIQPVEGISLSFGAKIPGAVLRVGSVDMSFEYSKYFGAD